MIKQIRKQLNAEVSLSKEQAVRFFKTGKGDYAEGDVFIGVSMPSLRKLSKKFAVASLDVLQELLHSDINEERMLALIILATQYVRADHQKKETLFQFYLSHLPHINNWNLVDASAHLIIGAHLWDKDRKILLQLAQSKVMWERRVAIVSTWYFIKKNDIKWTFKIADLLLTSPEDLIHKAVGWMLRETGKRNQTELEKYLDQHAVTMPRTMLRYAIEKFSEPQRKHYLALK